MAVNIVSDQCDYCGTCISVCPANALMLLSETLSVDSKRCTGCGICVAVCPFGALNLVPSGTASSGMTGVDHG
jgi:Fe-S-cluster-containing hydrogenase component 2